MASMWAQIFAYCNTEFCIPQKSVLRALAFGVFVDPMKEPMKTHADLILALGGATKIAVALGYEIPTVGAWKHRNKIPSEKWPDFVAFAEQVGVRLSLEDMFRLKAGVTA